MSTERGQLKKNPSISSLKLDDEAIKLIEKAITSRGLLQENIELRPSLHQGEENDNPEELLSKLNDFNVILKEPIICSGFRKFLASNFSSENLLFWKEIENYRTLTEPEELRKRAVEIFRDYISQTSENEINLPHCEKTKLQNALSDDSFLPTATFYDHAQVEIFNLMKRDSFLNYLKDPIFDETKKILERVRCLSVESVTEDELTERDWTLILTEAKEVEFKPNDRIVEQNEKNTFLYQLKSGKLLVEKNVSGTNIPIATIEKPGTIFGEMSVLGKLGVATASIVATSPVVVLRLEVPFIFAVFLSDPQLARRFYVNMGIKLAKLLQDISSLTPISPDPKKPLTRSSSGRNHRPLVRMNTTNRIAKEQIASSKKEDSDRTYHERFGLPTNELVVKEIICDFDKMVSRRGTLYISQHYICFYSKIFGQKTKEVFKIRHVVDVQERLDSKHPSLTLVLSSKGKFKFNFKSKEDVLSTLSVIQEFRTACEPSLSNSSEITPRAKLNSSGSKPSQSSGGEDSQSLTPEDWEILLGANKKSFLTFTKGDAILVEGQHYQMICQIVSGTCRIEKQLPDQPDVSIVLGKMHPGEIFGEITFLTEGAATASVYADDDFVDMYFIDGKYLKETLLETHPQVVVRFYNYLCINLAKRIAQREKEGWRKK